MTQTENNKKQQYYYVQKGIPIETPNKNKGMLIGAISIICAVFSLIFYPIIFGGFGIMFGIMSVNKGSNKLGVIGIVLSTVFMIFGLIISFVLYITSL